MSAPREPSAVEVVEGTVEANNEKGLKIKGQWYNVSKFRPVEIFKAPTGTRVRLGIDNNGWIRELEILEAKEPAPAAGSVARDDRITRLAVLKAAANFVGLWGQHREEIKSEHVLMLADKWLEWVNRE